MADTSIGSKVPVKYIDNGDGTYSLSVAAGVTVAGGPATIADGDDVTQGAKADAAVTNPASAATLVALLKGLLTVLEGTGTSALSAQGAAATGASVAGKPVMVGGKDSAGKAQPVAVSPAGMVVLGKSETLADAQGNVAVILESPFGDQNTTAPLAVFPMAFNGATWDRLPGTTVGVSVVQKAGTAGGATPYRNLDLGVTGQVVKNGAGQVYAIHMNNVAVAARYVKVYNKATAPTQADTPAFTFTLPASTSREWSIPSGAAFASGISLRATTGIADADTGAPTANDVVVNVAYA